MKILVKDYDKLTPFEKKAVSKLRLKYGMIGDYLKDAQYYAKVEPRLKPCTKIIIARNPKEVLGWALYTPQATSWNQLCNCKRLKNYYLQIYVSTKHRKKGVGSALIETAIKRGKKLGHQVMVFPHDHASSIIFSKYKELKPHPAWV